MWCRQRAWCVLLKALACFVIGRSSIVTGFNILSSERNRRVSLRQRSCLAQLCLFKNDERVWNKDSVSNEPLVQDSTPRLHRVQFAAPLLDYGHPPAVKEFQNGTISEKPILLYLPGFDGTYICPFIQYPELGTEFEVWCMTIGMNDRTTFDELKLIVLDFIEKLGSEEIVARTLDPPAASVERSPFAEANGNATATEGSDKPFWSSWFSPTANQKPIAKNGKRKLYLAGESFGGIVASEVALTLLETKGRGTKNVDLQGLVLINPATCYDRSQLAAKGPSIASLPPLLYPFGLAGLLPLFSDAYSFEQLILILSAKALPSVIDDPVREAFMGRVAFSLPSKLEYMNQGTLEWRLEEWLSMGCEKMESRMRDFQDHPFLRTLILVGENDLTLPSIAEAERLVNLFPQCQVHVVEGAGHASTCGSRVDLTAQLRKAFPELSKPTGKKTKQGEDEIKRTAMKPEAANGSGPYFGMEPRYDGASIGLNPILYWSKAYHSPMQKEEITWEITGSGTTIAYTTATYKPRKARLTASIFLQ